MTYHASGLGFTKLTLPDSSQTLRIPKFQKLQLEPEEAPLLTSPMFSDIRLPDETEVPQPEPEETTVPLVVIAAAAAVGLGVLYLVFRR